MVSKAKILLIDDDFLVLRTLARVGYETTAVDSGNKAIDLVKKKDFDLVMPGIRMPELDGVETIEIIQEHYRHHGKSCAYMFITAYSEDRRAKEIINSGQAKLMLKPFEVEDLLESIKLELQSRPSQAGKEFVGEWGTGKKTNYRFRRPGGGVVGNRFYSSLGIYRVFINFALLLCPIFYNYPK